MKLINLKKKLIKNYSSDKIAEKNNLYNEQVLTKEIKKIIKKNTTPPICTLNLLKK
jgi:hypothetical protein